MNTADILQIRLANQLLAGNKFTQPQEIVSYMGAMQAQTFDMARWAIGARLPGIVTDRRVIEAIDNAEIIRTHILRPTWHFVSAKDIYWMAELSRPRLRPIYASYARMMGVDDRIFETHWKYVERLLRDDNHLTRLELVAQLNQEGKAVDDYAVKRILDFAELEGLVCNGRVRGNKQTFCLLQERVAQTQALCKEEALEKLARKFFTSHAPATLADFIWWSGLLASDAKKALALIQDDFVAETANGRTFYMKNDLVIPAAGETSALLLPQFDEMVVSYKDRSEMIDEKHYGKVMTKNGLFSPTIMLNGEIIGSWRKVMNKKKPEVELNFFDKTTKQKQNLYKKVQQNYLDYLTGERETALFAGGCFWGVEYYMKQLPGVWSVESGYIGGSKENPSYEEVKAHTTGHAEAVRIVFDPAKTNYETLARQFFEIHDPTHVDHQGPDVGEQYRSEVFYTTTEQKEIAEKLIDLLKAKGLEVATHVTPATTFWPAEDYHQNYYTRKGTLPYCHGYTKRF